MASVLDVGDGDKTDGTEAGAKVVTGAIVEDGARVVVGAAVVVLLGVDLICIAMMTLSTHVELHWYNTSGLACTAGPDSAYASTSDSTHREDTGHEHQSEMALGGESPERSLRW